MRNEGKFPIGGYAPGNYHCTCCKCGSKFTGDKRAVECESCAMKDKEAFDALSLEEQTELVKRNAEILNSLLNNNSSNEQLSDTDQACGKTELSYPIMGSGPLAR